MPRIGHAPHRDVPIGPYTHKKTGGQYLVIGGVFLAGNQAQDDEVQVLYMSTQAGFVAARPVQEFRQKFIPVKEHDVDGDNTT